MIKMEQKPNIIRGILITIRQEEREKIINRLKSIMENADEGDWSSRLNTFYKEMGRLKNEKI